MAIRVPRGFTATEIEESHTTDGATILCGLVEAMGALADDFLDGDYAVQLVAETLTDGSVKRSVRIRAIDT